MAEILAVDPHNPDPSIIRRAAAILKNGGLVSFPTETVYGLGADATNPDAIQKIYEAKGRPATNPLILHCESVDRIRHGCVLTWPEQAQTLAEIFWPGPLTLILPKSLNIHEIATAGLSCVGVRIPANSVAQALIAATDRPIAAPSANLSNRISPTLAEHVNRDLGDRIELILDAGPCQAGVESTVVDLTGPQPVVLRPGPISVTELSQALGQQIYLKKQAASETNAQTSPGQLAVHYAPRKPMTLWVGCLPSPAEFDEDQSAVLKLGDLGALSQRTERPPNVIQILEIEHVKEAEQKLYGLLHQFDQDPDIRSIHVILGSLTDQPQWQAVVDRLMRAAGDIRTTRK